MIGSRVTAAWRSKAMQVPYSFARRSRQTAIAIGAAALLTTPLLVAQGSPASGTPPDHVTIAAGRIRLGFLIDARPFAYQGDPGKAAGYAIDLCQSIASDVQRQPGSAGVKVEWVPVSDAERFSAVQRGRIDILCGADTASLERRAQVSFSIPIFAGGVAAAVRADAPAALREVLSGGPRTQHPTWRAAATQVLQARSFTAIQGTTADAWLTSRIRDLNVIADVSRVSSYDAGVQAVIDRKSDVFFGERAVLLDVAKRSRLTQDLTIVDRRFTYEPLAIAVARGDEDLRLLVDRTLSRLYTSGEIGTVYAKWFGTPDEQTLTFFRSSALPE
jgi:ABC-type amino acid transport substrate-binding protein